MNKHRLSYFFPQTIEEIESPINGKIKIVKFLGKPRIIVNKMLESGGILEEIWKKGIKRIIKLSNPPAGEAGYQIANCLILGLGGGTVAQLVNRYFPQVKITGVEIDPVMINIGKKYFGLDRIKNLKIIQADAIKIISHQPPATSYQLPITLPRRQAGNHYSLILVDLYVGDQIPLQAEAVKYLIKLKKLLTNKGIIIFNRLFYAGHRAKTEIFVKKINNLFSNIELVRSWSNLLIICRI